MTRVTGVPAESATETDRGSRNLKTRVVAAVILAPLSIAIAYAGGWWWASLATLTAMGLLVEWLIIVGSASHQKIIAAGVVALLAAGFSIATGRIEIAALAVAAGAVVAAAFADEQRWWVVGGLIYSGLALLASVVIRLDARSGFVALIFILLIVWITDIGGYFAGRGLGGPKLWPRVSPKKTWAGAIGGLFGSLLIAAATSALGYGRLGVLLPLAAVLSVVSQLGDLFESAVKRNFGVKDSSHIIPGHGGLLDRLDGFVAAIVVAAIIGLLRGGTDGAGHGLMDW